MKNLSRKNARPATITKNQKQTMSLTTLSTEGDMYNKVLLRVCQKVCIKRFYINVLKIESYIKNYFTYLLYI